MLRNFKVHVGPPPRSERGELACHANGVAARLFFQRGDRTASASRGPTSETDKVARCKATRPNSSGKAIVFSAGSFTLIELLVAVAVAGLLLAVVMAVYGSILNTIITQNRWRAKALPAADALDLIIRDLACAVIPAGVTNPPFTAAFSGEAEEKFRLNFYSAFAVASSNDWRGYSISAVSYSLRGAAQGNEFILTRECKPWRAPSRNPLASGREKWQGIRKLEADFYNGTAWTNGWGGAKSTNGLPQAARIKLTAGKNDPRAVGSEVFINAARQVAPKKLK